MFTRWLATKLRDDIVETLMKDENTTEASRTPGGGLSGTRFWCLACARSRGGWPLHSCLQSRPCFVLRLSFAQAFVVGFFLVLVHAACNGERHQCQAMPQPNAASTSSDCNCNHSSSIVYPHNQGMRRLFVRTCRHTNTHTHTHIYYLATHARTHTRTQVTNVGSGTISNLRISVITP